MCRRWFARYPARLVGALLLIGTPGVVAQEPSLLFSDDFSAGFGQWEVAAGTWTVDHGELVGVGHGGYIDAWIYAGDPKWTDYSFSAKVTFVTGEAEFVFRSTGHWENEYRVLVWSPASDGEYDLQFRKYADAEGDAGGFESLLEIKSPVPITNPTNLRIDVIGENMTFFVNDAVAFTWHDENALPSGRVGLGAIWDWTCRFDDVVVRDLTIPPTIPVIIQEPQSTEVPVGTPAAFEVRALGEEPVEYQWLRNGMELEDADGISGSSTRRLEISAVRPDDAGSYTVVLQNAYGSVSSAPASLTVTLQPPSIPAESVAIYVADFQGIVGPEWSDGQLAVTPVGSRRFLGEFGNDTVSLTLDAMAAHEGISISFDLYVIRTWDGSGPVTAFPDIWDLSVAGGPTLVHTTFSNSDPINPVQAFPGDFPGGENPAQTGATEVNSLGFGQDSVYHFLLSFPHSDRAVTFMFSGMGLEPIWNESWGLDNVSIRTMAWPPPPLLTQEPTSVEVPVGINVTFEVRAVGEGPIQYRWEVNGTRLQDGQGISGSSTSKLQISAVAPENAGAYSVVVSNANGSVTSAPATLTVLLRPPEITIGPEDQAATSGASATFTVATAGSLPMTFQWRRNGVDLADDGGITGTQTDTLNIAAAGIEDLGAYTVLIRNAYGSVTSLPATLTVILQPPDITSDPTDQTVFSGAPASFSVIANGSLPLEYQWQRNGVDLADGGRISGAQTGSLTIAAAEPEDLGLYVVEVQNTYGWTVSYPAQLTVVLAPPTITGQPHGQALALGADLTLHVQATGSLPLRYQWRREGVELEDGERISGAKTGILTISELTTDDLGDYSVMVENSLGRTESRLATIVTSSAVLRIHRDGANVLVSWNEAGKGMKLLRTSSLTTPDWQEVSGSESVMAVTIPLTGPGAAFFRLQGPRLPKYSIIEGMFTWHEAKADAEARGGHLVTITSDQEWTEIKAQLGEPAPEWGSPWIGATDEAAEGEWTWVTGEPWAYSHWCGGEPNNSGGHEHYALVIIGWSQCADGRWNDDSAWWTAPYILEME